MLNHIHLPSNITYARLVSTTEKLKQKGHEVLYVSEPIDEMTLQNIEKFSDKMITDAGREATTDLSDDEKREKEKANEDLEGFRKWLKGVLGDKITRVEVSTRLVDSPATLVQSEYGVSPSMQKYLRAQAVVENDSDGQFSNIFNQAVLEVNPSHPIIERLKGERYLFHSDCNAIDAQLVFIYHCMFTHCFLFLL
jgi:HSP90 family molecular chaperone